MDDLQHFGGRPGTAYDEAWWQAVFTLYDEAFPGLPAGIEHARRTGWSWEGITTPFATFTGGRCVSFVGVLGHPLVVHGEATEIAGFHAVCTASDHRRRGLARRTLAAACAWSDERFPVAKLHTDDPQVYTGHGFRPTPTWRFESTLPRGARPERRLLQPSTSSTDAALLHDLLARRTPASHRLATADPGWLTGIDAALTGRLDTSLWYLPEHDAVVGFDDKHGRTLITEVIAETLPPAEVVLAAAPDPAQPASWTFCPDRLDPDATPVAAPPAIGVFMVRGEWPIEGPFGVSPLWEH